jgi:hypothetical protein
MVVAAVWVGLTAVLVAPSRAQGDQDGDAADAPATAPTTSDGGSRRLIKIGPQALVEVSEDGRVNMVDEAPPEMSRGTTLAIVLGATLGGGLIPLALPMLTGATNPSPGR